MASKMVVELLISALGTPKAPLEPQISPQDPTIITKMRQDNKKTGPQDPKMTPDGPDNDSKFSACRDAKQKTIEDDGSATPFFRTHVIPVPLLLDRPTLRADLVCGGQTRSVYNPPHTSAGWCCMGVIKKTPKHTGGVRRIVDATRTAAAHQVGP